MGISDGDQGSRLSANGFRIDPRIRSHSMSTKREKDIIIGLRRAENALAPWEPPNA